MVAFFCNFSAYDQCTAKTILPSERSFLFSLKSDAGKATYIPIQPKKYSSSFDCSNVNQSFPNFGNDLILDLVSKAVKATYGKTYGSTSGSFVKGLDLFNLIPSDLEVLTPKGTSHN